MRRTDSGKDPDAGKDRRQEEKGTTEDEMVGWHHPLNGHEFEQALGVSDRQGGLACCSPWGRKELDTRVTELKHNTSLSRYNISLLLKCLPFNLTSFIFHYFTLPISLMNSLWQLHLRSSLSSSLFTAASLLGVS